MADRLSKGTRDWLWQLFGPQSTAQFQMAAFDHIAEMRSWLAQESALDPPSQEQARRLQQTAGKEKG